MKINYADTNEVRGANAIIHIIAERNALRRKLVGIKEALERANPGGEVLWLALHDSISETLDQIPEL